MEEFSACILTKNEEKTLPRLLDSLKGVDDIVVLDSGSTDKTVEIAEKYGARVFQGDFRETPTKEDIATFKKRYGFKPSFTTKDKLFNYGAARNHIMTLAKHDFCFFPDADEVVKWDLDEIKKLLPNCDQLKYRFCFSHNPDGTCQLEFTHCKFFRRSKAKWTKKVHEVIGAIDESRIAYTDKIYLNHYQTASENRTNYLSKLEYSILEEENDDRNTYYLAREYYYHWEYDKSLKMFERYHQLNSWLPEKGNAYILMGDCYQFMGDSIKAEEYYHKAMMTDDTRREAFFAIGNMFYAQNRFRSAAIYLRAALEIPYNKDYYLNHLNLYTYEIHDLLSLVYDKLGEYDKAQEQWLAALRQKPNDERILANGKWFCRQLPTK